MIRLAATAHPTISSSTSTTNLGGLRRAAAHATPSLQPCGIASVPEMYAHGPRCPDLVEAIACIPDVQSRPSPLLQARIAGYIFVTWECDADGVLVVPSHLKASKRSNQAKESHAMQSGDAEMGEHRTRLTRFASYLHVLVSKLRPHVISLLLAALLVGRLRRAHPRARGEPGCAHRLFVVSLMLAMRYIELDADLVASYGFDPSLSLAENANLRCTVDDRSAALEATETWATLSGIFTAPELHKMEVELASFIRYDLYVAEEDLRYWAQAELFSGHPTGMTKDGRARWAWIEELGGSGRPKCMLRDVPEH